MSLATFHSSGVLFWVTTGDWKVKQERKKYYEIKTLNVVWQGHEKGHWLVENSQQPPSQPKKPQSWMLCQILLDRPIPWMTVDFDLKPPGVWFILISHKVSSMKSPWAQQYFWGNLHSKCYDVFENLTCLGNLSLAEYLVSSRDVILSFSQEFTQPWRWEGRPKAGLEDWDL